MAIALLARSNFKKVVYKNGFVRIAGYDLET